MKLLSIINKSYPVLGGAQITNIAFLQALSKRYRHDCRVYTNLPFKKKYSCQNIRIQTFRNMNELQIMIRKWKPDCIISALEISHHVLKEAKKFNIPTIVNMRSFEYCPPTLNEKIAWKVSLNRKYPTDEERNFVLHESDLIITASDYLRKRLKQKYGINSKVIYSEFIKNNIVYKKSYPPQNRYITGCCGFRYKGADIFYALAKFYTSERFLLVGIIDREYIKKFRKLKNVTILKYSPPKQFLRISKIVLAPSQLPEGFGRIAVEAMANGIPVLASLAGGLKEIVGTSSMGVNNFRNIKAWQKKLTRLLSSPEACELNSQEGKALSRKFLKGDQTKKLNKLIKNIAHRRTPDFNPKKVVALCGKTYNKTAFSLINSQWSKKIKENGNYDLLNVQDSCDFKHYSLDYFIHHDYQQNFKNVSAPAEGKFVAVRTWDFGRFPPSWAEKINCECDQLWVHSRWVKKQAIASGIASKKIKVVPHGIDKNVYKTSGKKYALPTNKSFKFIFNGATIIRKGIDILLKAYEKAFDASDNVCLIIKDNPKDVFYSGINFKSKILRYTKNKKNPEIIYINNYLSTNNLASLYRACNVGVFPYRAEGFAMPILEAMACGVPSIVPNFGACLDFCSRKTSFLMPVKNIHIPISGNYAINTLGFNEKVDEVNFCETEVATLAFFLKKVFHSSRKILYYKSRKGASTACDKFTWENTVKQIDQNLKALDRYKMPFRVTNNKRKHADHVNTFEVAQELFHGLQVRKK